MPSTEDGELDSLYDQAVQIVFENREVSTLLVKNQLRISYRLAARLIKKMKSEGIVSALAFLDHLDVLQQEQHATSE
jgi:S-DNA-T family DNA segregation ATPase FtsK/SpoIIIE